MSSLAFALLLGALMVCAHWLNKPFLAGVIGAIAAVYLYSILYEALMKIFELLSPS
ncbi:MAG: hypothetical protein SW833_06585 [Cyanobacteriota bacterium]|nr:hypothetical protein [Cyanobacteriota bacterium]